MQFIAGLLLFSIFFIGIFLIGLYLVFSKSWIGPWLRANIGIFCLFVGIAGGAGLLLLADMQAMDGEYQFGEADIRQLGETATILRISTDRIGEREIELTDVDWRLRAVHLRWSGALSMIGLSDGVLLYDLQQSNGRGFVASTIVEHQAVVKAWEFGRAYLHSFPGINFELLSTEWRPTDLKTRYELRVTKAGFTLKDLDTPAKSGTAQALFEPQGKPRVPITNSETETETNNESNNGTAEPAAATRN